MNLEVQEFVYLGQVVREIQHKGKNSVMTGWKAFNKDRNIKENALQICLKCQVYNECVMPAMTNGCQIAKQINCLQIKLQLHKDH